MIPLESLVLIVKVAVAVLAAHAITCLSGVKFGYYIRQAEQLGSDVLFMHSAFHFLLGVINVFLGMILAYVVATYIYGLGPSSGFEISSIFGGWLLALFIIWIIVEWLAYHDYI